MLQLQYFGIWGDWVALGDQGSSGGQGEDMVGFQRPRQGRKTKPAMRWQWAPRICDLLHRCEAHNHWAYWADPSERESNDRLIAWATDVWRCEGSKVAWADCSHSRLSALGFTEHVPEKPCSVQDIQTRSDKTQTLIFWSKRVVPSRKVTVKLISVPP